MRRRQPAISYDERRLRDEGGEDVSGDEDVSDNEDADYVDDDDEERDDKEVNDITPQSDSEDQATTSVSPVITASMSEYEKQRAQTIIANNAYLSKLGLNPPGSTSKKKRIARNKLPTPMRTKLSRSTRKSDRNREQKSKTTVPRRSLKSADANAIAQQRIALSVPRELLQQPIYRIEFERDINDWRELYDGSNGSNAVLVANRVFNDPLSRHEAVLPCGKKCVIGYDHANQSLYCSTAHDDGKTYLHRLRFPERALPLPRLPKYSADACGTYARCPQCGNWFVENTDGSMRKHYCKRTQ